MREIKFRAWNKELKIMDYGNGELTGYNVFDCSPVKAVNDIINENYPELEWMQYTGLQDRNGKEIYEGDICKSTRGYDFIVRWGKGTVRFLGKVITKTQERYCCYVDEVDKNGEVSVEVIGNIYENPELLEV